MTNKKVYSFNMFNLHIHRDPLEIIEEFPYDSFFEFLKTQREPVEKRETMTAIAKAFETIEATVFKIVSGELNDVILEYNQNGGLIEIKPSRGGTFVRDTYIIYFKGMRKIAVQNTRLGVTRENLQYILESYLKQFTQRQESTLFMQAIYSSSFADEVNKLTRIQSARITLRLPNPSWYDSSKELMTPLINESSGDTGEIKVAAPRGKSLKKDEGIVKIIKDCSQENIKGVNSFSVRGAHPDTVGLTNISSGNYLAKSSDKIEYEKDSPNFIASLVEIAKRLSPDGQ